MRRRRSGAHRPTAAARAHQVLPRHQAFDRLRELFTFVFARNGADPLIGRRLGELYRQAGLEDIGLEARAGLYPLGHSRRTIGVDLIRAMRPQILDLGAADEAELDSLDTIAREYLDNPDVVRCRTSPSAPGAASQASGDDAARVPTDTWRRAPSPAEHQRDVRVDLWRKGDAHQSHRCRVRGNRVAVGSTGGAWAARRSRLTWVPPVARA